MSKAQIKFHQNNRKKLRKIVDEIVDSSGLIVITGNSLIQSSADTTYPFVQDSNFMYLTGITEPEIILVIDGNDEYLIVPERDVVRTAFEGAIDTNSMIRASGIETVFKATEGWNKLTQRIQQTKQIATFEAPESYISHHEMFTNPSRQRLISRVKQMEESVQLHDLRKDLAVMRMIKSEHEIEMIQQAIIETAKLFEAIEKIRTQVTHEHELLAEITQLSILNQCTNAYDPIIASGKNALTLHYIKNNALLDKSGMLLLDIGLKYNGYCADITRTIAFNPDI